MECHDCRGTCCTVGDLHFETNPVACAWYFRKRPITSPRQLTWQTGDWTSALLTEKTCLTRCTVEGKMNAEMRGLKYFWKYDILYHHSSWLHNLNKWLHLLEFKTQIGWKAKPKTSILIVVIYIYIYVCLSFCSLNWVRPHRMTRRLPQSNGVASAAQTPTSLSLELVTITSSTSYLECY